MWWNVLLMLLKSSFKVAEVTQSSNTKFGKLDTPAVPKAYPFHKILIKVPQIPIQIHSVLISATVRVA